MKRRDGTPARHQLRARAAPDGLPDKLPLIHVTAVGSAREIVRSGQLETRDCPVFKKKLLYFFALRPAYRLKDDDKSHQINRFPVVFIIRPEAVDHPYHVYPFDTGGAASGVFKEQADPYEYLEDYELEPTHKAVAGQIGWAFGTMAAYLDGDFKDGLLKDVPPHETATRGFFDIARLAASSSNQPDMRASAIEVAYDHNIRLKDHVALVILPKQYLEEDGPQPNAEFIARLRAENIDWKVYDWQPNKAPSEFQDEIARIARAFYRTYYKDKGYQC